MVWNAGEHWSGGCPDADGGRRFQTPKSCADGGSISSPRMWGTLRQCQKEHKGVRFIPTHVGNSTSGIRTRCCDTVHPHACGELRARHGGTLDILGSSPRMWGTQGRRITYRERCRFIPTHVGNSCPERPECGGATVHPHACGELYTVAGVPLVRFGSSPRMWGTHQAGGELVRLGRFIPTHVGNSSCTNGKSQNTSVHPHACGELNSQSQRGTTPVGSSPRMWGTPGVGQGDDEGPRFIPTHVGNSPTGQRIQGSIPVHPHACGELYENPHLPPLRVGSSPRMWGTLLDGLRVRVPIRFIPTHVGNSASTSSSHSRISVHPHACGELGIRVPSAISITGSSPRMWGTPGTARSSPVSFRFIPTHVGNSERKTDLPVRISVHPHACGELLNFRPALLLLLGSSPRMWGTPPPPPQTPKKSRFIPTHVGNSSRCSSCATRWSVHPHACGELQRHEFAPVGRVGSSPRMWGTHRGARGPYGAARFIPTHVGNSVPMNSEDFPQSVHPHACGELAAGDITTTTIVRFIPTHVGNSGTYRYGSLLRAVHPHACGELPTRPSQSATIFGSSPRMWGTRPRRRVWSPSPRFIPTHVGNSPSPHILS